MNISAISCTPIKPQVSFGEKEDGNVSKVIELPADSYTVVEDENKKTEENGNTKDTEGKNTKSSEYNTVMNITEELNNSFVKSDNIKKPAAAVASVALAIVSAFAAGRALAGIATTVCKNLPTKMDSGLKFVSNKLKDSATSLANNEGRKFVKAKQISGKVLGKTEEIARNVYKKIANIGINADSTAAEKASTAFKNVVGVATVAATVPELCTKDHDNNGVADLMEKATNAYDGTTKRSAQLIAGATKVADIVGQLT